MLWCPLSAQVSEITYKNLQKSSIVIETKSNRQMETLQIFLNEKNTTGMRLVLEGDIFHIVHLPVAGTTQLQICGDGQLLYSYALFFQTQAAQTVLQGRESTATPYLAFLMGVMGVGLSCYSSRQLTLHCKPSTHLFR